MRAPTAHASRLLHVALRRSSLVERLRGESARVAAVRELATLAEVPVIPALLPLIPADDRLGQEAAHTVTALWRHVGAVELAWIDEQARSCTRAYGDTWVAWTNITAKAVPRLAQYHAGNPVVLGLFACHTSGYVREAAVKELGRVVDGQELPFLALRANDWVWPVAERAAELLTRRLVPEARHAVAAAFPFLARMVGQRRRDHRRLADAIQRVIRSDAGEALLARIRDFDARVRRQAFDMLNPGEGGISSAVLRAALQDRDPVVRSRVVRQLAKTPDPEAVRPVLEHLLTKDSVAVVRAEALALLAEQARDRAAEIIPAALLDPGASVRSLARFLVSKLSVRVVPRDVYLGALQSSRPRQLAAAIEGLGETGDAADACLVLSFASHPVPRVRRAALRACARLAAPLAVERATVALGDPAPAVRRSARQMLVIHRRHVDFHNVRKLVRELTDPASRKGAFTVLARAGKWDALEFLLEALGDLDADVRGRARALLEGWAEGYNRSQARPSQQQLDRLRVLLKEHEGDLSEPFGRLLRFTLGSTALPGGG